MRECGHCGSAFEARFRFCPWCGAAQRLKIVEYFPALRLSEADEGRGLRVSRYLTVDGQVRLSVWNVGEVEAAVSLDEAEARRLARFLRATEPPRGRPRLGERLRREATLLRESLR
jgi:hypothetical protein